MQFLYNPRKAAQAAAYLVSLNGGRMDLLSLIKILYLSDRKALSQRGRTITGDEMVSMPHGPVLSRIYDTIKCGTDEDAAQSWYEYMTEREDNTISVRNANPPVDELSQYERGTLEEVLAQYGHFKPFELRALTHELPEYKDPQGSSLPIDPVTILRETGWPEEDIQDALISAREEVFLNKVCA